MNSLQENDSPDPIELELSSWKTADVPLDIDDRLTAGMRSGWASASIGADSQDGNAACDAMASSLSKDARPAEVITSRRSWFIAGGTLLATATSLAVIALLVMGERSVYAQAIAAIANARSLHAVIRQFDDQGNVTGSSIELWYDASHGVRQQFIRDGVLSSVMIDDGQHVRVYMAKLNTVVKDSSHDPSDKVKPFLEPLEMIEKHGGIVDTKMVSPNDLPGCHAHVSHQKPEDTPSRIVFWIDEQRRLRRLETFRMLAGGWVRNEQHDITYDVEIPAETFLADFGDARLIERANDAAPRQSDVK